MYPYHKHKESREDESLGKSTEYFFGWSWQWIHDTPFWLHHLCLYALWIVKLIMCKIDYDKDKWADEGEVVHLKLKF